MSVYSPRDLVAYLDRILPVLDQLSYFELLDVSPNADAKGIREAFYRKASSLHPDLYRLLLDTDDYERLTRVYARIALAYLTLRDSRARAEYTRKFAVTVQKTSGPSGVDAEAMLPPKARRLYQRARTSLRTGDYASAVLNLRMAVASAPESALLRNALADALGHAPSAQVKKDQK